MRKRTMLLAGVSAVAALTMAGCATQDAVESPASASASPTQATPAAAASPSASGSADLLGTVTHTNRFDMFAGDGVTSMNYAWDGNYSVTSNQQSTWGGVTSYWGQIDPTYPTDPTIYFEDILVKTGRYASSDVFNWFVQRAPQFSCERSNSDCNVTTMNFAFTGTLTINGTDYPIVIGQVGIGDHDVWFYGGQGWQAQPQYFWTPDGKYALTNPAGGGKVTVVAAA